MKGNYGKTIMLRNKIDVKGRKTMILLRDEERNKAQQKKLGTNVKVSQGTFPSADRGDQKKNK